MKKILTFGVFDFFHLGHLRLFKQCKKYADYLVVALQDGECLKEYKDETNVFYSTEERLEIIESIKEVDEVVVYTHVSIEELEKFDFDILALGEDHIGERFDNVTQWCKDHGKEVVRLKRTQGISSTDIKKEVRGLN